jgi:hypothetical protein
VCGTQHPTTCGVDDGSESTPSRQRGRRGVIEFPWGLAVWPFEMEVESLEVRQQDLIQSCMFMHERLPGQARTGQDRTGQDRTG